MQLIPSYNVTSTVLGAVALQTYIVYQYYV